MDDDTQDETVTRLLERAQFYRGCGLPDDALRFAREAEALAPDDLRVRQFLDSTAPKREPRVHKISPRKAAAATDSDSLAASFAEARRARDWRAAAAAAQELVDAHPDDPRAWSSLASALRRTCDFDAAISAHDRACALVDGDPAYAQARAKTLWEAGRYNEADSAYSDLIAGVEEGSSLYADLMMSRAMIRMTTQGPAAGVDDYEWRWQAGEIMLPDIPQPYWDGAPQPDKRVLFFGEQGFGDAIHFARYVPLIGVQCAKVVLPCKEPLKRLMQSLGDTVEVCDQMIARDSFDFFVPAMSAMRLLGAAEQDLPADVPYLAAQTEDLQRLRPKIAGHSGLRIGIAWTGSPTNAHDWKRAIPPAVFRPIVDRPDTVVFNLQKVRDETPPDLCNPPEGTIDITADLADFADTAAAIECLDLVITADTSVAHLAGALGKPVWVLLSKVPDWRWMTDRDDSPWYPTMRLYRQREFGDWPEVMGRILADLSGFKPPATQLKKRGLTRLLPWRR